MRIQVLARFLLSSSLLFGTFLSGSSQNIASDASQATAYVPARVVERIDENRLVKLTGNTHPMARAESDRGSADTNLVLRKMVMVLKRSAQQEADLAAFNERQYDPTSPDFHRWLDAEEFGRLYGPSDADMAAVTSWLKNSGFQIDEVSKGRVSIQFTGTIAEVQKAFHVEMHRYLVNGKVHLANDRDPEIPEALSPVVTGIASLNDFFPKHYSHPGNFVKRDLKTGKYSLVAVPYEPGSKLPPGDGLQQPGTFKETGKQPSNIVQPEFGYVDASTGYQREELSPYDVATIYNILPLWNQTTPINGKGVKVAIVGLSDVQTSDFNTFRSSFGLPAGTLTTLHSGADPGITDSQGENTEDVEMVSSTAPGAQVVLVADVDNATTNGLVTAVDYIVENKVAPILTMSYGACELENGTSSNSMFNQIFQQAATAGISSFVASGDSGSGVCTRQGGQTPYADNLGLQVSGMASTPYVTAVGGTDLQWPFTEAAHPISTYWNSTNDSHGASAKGYMPEMSWNDTCTNPLLLNVYTGESSSETLCNDAISSLPGLVEMASGSGGVSHCTTPSGTTSASCSGGYAKPSWQTGVAGIPNDGKRDLPDVSLFAAFGFQSSTGIPGSALLVCQASGSPDTSCDYSDPSQIVYQENGGTSASSPLTAGVMALVVQKTGSAQGLANPVFYQLAAKENYANCNSNTVAAGNTCIFYDTTSGSNAAVCYTGDPNCVTNTSGDQAGILSGYKATTGYDLTTGLGSFNVTNLVNAWPTSSGTTTAVTVTPTSVTFPSTAVGTTSTTTQVVTLKNTGTTVETISSASLSNPTTTSFSKTTTCGSTVAAGASCTYTISFTPSSAGAHSGTLTIQDTAGTQTVSMSGTGVASSLTVTATPTSLTFASTAVGATTAAQAVTVKNTGTSTVTLGTVSFTGTNASSFLKSATTCGTSLAASASCTISVEFKPAAAGALTASLSIADNASGSPQLVALKGTGVASALTVTLSPTSIAFPNTVTGVASSAQTVTLKNTGTATVGITSIALTGNTSSFVELNSCGTTLAAGASCPIYISFQPATAVAKSATVSVTDTASGSPQSVALTGTGTAAPTVKLSATSITFPTTKTATTSAAQTITVTNSGTTTLDLFSITLTGTNPTDFQSLNNCGTTLAPNAACSVYVAFKPASAAAFKATLSITDNGTGSPQSVTLAGTGN